MGWGPVCRKITLFAQLLIVYLLLFAYRDEGKDEPFAWESREFLRKKLIGKEVTFLVEYRVPSSGREYGAVYLGKDPETGENVTEDIVREGFASVRKEGKSDVSRLVELEEQAKSAGRGRWAPDTEVSFSIMVVKLTFLNNWWYVRLRLVYLTTLIAEAREGCCVASRQSTSFIG